MSDPTPLTEEERRKSERARSCAERLAQTRQRKPAEQREFEAGFDAGWRKRGLPGSERERALREVLPREFAEALALPIAALEQGQLRRVAEQLQGLLRAALEASDGE